MKNIFTKAEKFTEPQKFKKLGLYPYFVQFSATIGSRTSIQGKETIMLGSNNYMGLTSHPEMLKAAKNAIDQFGTGCTGSRLLNGTLDLHNEMEEKLSKFLEYDDTIAFSTGFQVNIGIIGALTTKRIMLFLMKRIMLQLLMDVAYRKQKQLFISIMILKILKRNFESSRKKRENC